MILALLKEGKSPPDFRVPLSPAQCAYIKENTGFDIIVQSSEHRAIADEEYQNAGIELVEDVSDADVLLGVKEVPIAELIEGKTYFFFSHTIKEQPYNRGLLQAMLKKNIRMVDYEVLTNNQGHRLIAFGKFAGMVGAHNALYTYGKRTHKFSMPRMNQYKGYEEAGKAYASIDFPTIRIVLSGTGRVGNGAAKVLLDLGFDKISPTQFLRDENTSPVFCQLEIEDYYQHIDGREFNRRHFFESPSEYKSIFAPYTERADILIHGIYWDPEAPKFFTKDQMQKSNFNIEVIADITCDIAPESSIPSTLRASTISQPIYGYNPFANAEAAPYQSNVIDVMAVDNLPNELPRDASEAFGEMFIEHVLPELAEIEKSEMIRNATICNNGSLGEKFQYLNEYAFGD